MPASIAAIVTQWAQADNDFYAEAVGLRLTSLDAERPMKVVHEVLTQATCTWAATTGSAMFAGTASSQIWTFSVATPSQREVHDPIQSTQTEAIPGLGRVAGFEAAPIVGGHSPATSPPLDLKALVQRVGVAVSAFTSSASKLIARPQGQS